jgi:hypothetical protein
MQVSKVCLCLSAMISIYGWCAARGLWGVAKSVGDTQFR